MTSTSTKVRLLLMFTCLMLTSTAHASFDASCLVIVIVKKAYHPAKSGHLGSGLKLSFKVHKILKQWGHDKAYCARKKMMGKSYEAMVGFFKKGPSPKQVKAGTRLYLKYHYSHYDGEKGADEHVSWLAKAPPIKPKGPRPSKKPSKQSPR